MKLLIAIVYICAFSSLKCAIAGNIVISNPVLTDWGTWGNWQNCTPGKYAVAFQLQTEKRLGSGDDTALNGIKLFCDAAGKNGLNDGITSSVGEWGQWGQVFYCEGIMTGFQLRSEEPLGMKFWKSSDDTAANNLKVFCATTTLNYAIEGDGQSWGNWTREQRCLARQAICGIRTQVESNQGSGDDTALTNVRMECCDIPNPGVFCNTTDTWDLIVECDNSEGLVATKCSFDKRKGISTTESSSSGEYIESKIMFEVGFSIDYVREGLSANFETNLQTSTVTSHSWSTESSETWSEESKYTVELEVLPGMITKLFQVVGNCNYFTVHTTKFKRRDTRKHHNYVDRDVDFVWQ